MSSAISAAELARLRKGIERQFRETGQIQRHTRTPDGRGSYTEGWNTLATVPCLRTPRELQTPDEKAIADRMGVATLWTISVPAGQDVKPADQIVIGSTTYQVLSVLRKTTELARRVIAAEVK